MPRIAILLAFVMIAAACGSGFDDATVSVTDPPAVSPGPQDGAAPGSAPSLDDVESIPSALDDRTNPAFPDPLIDPDAIISGGPPPDGIPPIDEPQFVGVADADAWLEDDEPVVYVTLGGETKIYPVQILIWHEIVNDTVGGVPVAVTYCPLCNSAVSYRRVIDGRETTFGTSGRLYNSALVMYDRLTESLWTHYDGTAVVGYLAGTKLEPIPSPLIGWGDAKELFADALVLDRERTGHRRAYGSNPYAGYDNPDGTPFLFRGDADDRAAIMQRVVGVAVGDAAVAWPLDLLQSGEASVTEGTVGDVAVVVFWKAGQSTALETDGVGTGRDVGSVGVFVPVVDGRHLTFEVEGDRFVDVETGSVWSIAGTAVEGELAGAQLEQVHHLDTFWFAWSSYQPDTTLVEATG